MLSETVTRKDGSEVIVMAPTKVELAEAVKTAKATEVVASPDINKPAKG